MRIQKILYNVNTYYVKKIVPEAETIKDIEVLNLKHKYTSFCQLLKQNKAIKRGNGKKLSLADITVITKLSKSKYYRINKEIKTKGSNLY
jgi:phosphopantetheinyl transferase (holo-ACP synthase)